jgi:hypothetical protein
MNMHGINDARDGRPSAHRRRSPSTRALDPGEPTPPFRSRWNFYGTVVADAT